MALVISNVKPNHQKLDYGFRPTSIKIMVNKTKHIQLRFNKTAIWVFGYFSSQEISPREGMH